MAKAIAITGEWTAFELRRLAAPSKHVNQSRRLLSLAAVLDGMNRLVSLPRTITSIGMRDWAYRSEIGRAHV